LQISLVGIPLLFLVEENPSANYFIRVSIVFIYCVSVLGLLFVPKLRDFYYPSSEQEQQRQRGSVHISGVAYTSHSSDSTRLNSGTINLETTQLLRKYKTLERMLVQRGLEGLLVESGLADGSPEQPKELKNKTHESVASFAEEVIPNSEEEIVDA
jgi:hypothetical protein